jgi:ubiquinone biosynthesis protein Coq4
MLTLHPTDGQAAVIVQALHAVATAQGTVALESIERDSIVEIQRHLLHLEQPIEPAASTLPGELATAIVEPAMRRSVVQILALLPVIDKRILAAKVAVVEEAARRLETEDRGLEILRLAVKGKFRSIGFSAMMRSVGHYWSPTGKMRVRDWLDMLRNFLPPVPGLYQMIGDQALLARFRGLGQLPSDTLGHALYRFYTDRGFALPGEPKSFPEGWAKHEAYHVLSEYEVNNQGEMLLAAFSGGNSRLLCMDLLMVTLLQFQAGKRVVPGPLPIDELRPAAFFRALARGASMNVDLLGGQWNLWPEVDKPIAALRTTYNVPPLSAEERHELSGWQALIA